MPNQNVFLRNVMNFLQKCKTTKLGENRQFYGKPLAKTNIFATIFDVWLNFEGI